MKNVNSNILANRKSDMGETEYYIQKLNDLDKSLTEIELSKSNDINVFYATGMTTQEIKHSAFLAWLINPKQSHDLGNLFLSFLLQRLIERNNEFDNVKSNSEILYNQGFSSLSEFSDFLSAQDISVETEKTITSPDSRIDIFIQSFSTDTTIIVENKIFTSTHDDQLKRYQDESALYKGKKIYIYLTPHGDIPTGIDGDYQSEWCVLSYKDISDITKKILKETQNNRKHTRLKFLMEDYVKMIDTNVLKNNDNLRLLCKQIKEKHADAIELLLNYTDNTEQVVNFAYKWIMDNIPTISKTYVKNKVFCGYTKPIEEFYVKNGCKMDITDSWFKFQFQLYCNPDGYTGMLMGIGKETDKEWTYPDMEIRKILMPNKKMTNKYCTLYSFCLLTADEFQGTMDEIEPVLSVRLSEFAKKLKDLEESLAKL